MKILPLLAVFFLVVAVNETGNVWCVLIAIGLVGWSQLDLLMRIKLQNPSSWRMLSGFVILAAWVAIGTISRSIWCVVFSALLTFLGLIDFKKRLKGAIQQDEL